MHGKYGLTKSTHIEDTTQLEQPDTPAPVFAARAFKSALFGSPAKRNDGRQNRPARALDMAANEREISTTPSKPPGILLTPGTGTTRRKRVSFGHEVPSRLAAKAQNNASSKGDQQDTKGRTNASQKRDTLATSKQAEQKQDDSDEWEEADEDDYAAGDMTLDLNEPHSQSGKYWKEEFQRYHEDAKAELEKLLKYKQLAKTYAQQKDAEAIQLAEKLKEEQQKVIQMERLIAENTKHIASAKQEDPAGAEPSDELLEKLSKQTELAAQYREKVLDLEDQLDTVLREIESQPSEKQKRRRQGSASPSTHKALIETQRELRQAKSQLREMSSMRDQLAKMKRQLETAKQHTAAEQSRPADTSRMRDLRDKLGKAQEESAQKDEQMQALRAEFEAYREETTSHDADTRAVLERANSKIMELKKELKAAKSANTEKNRPKSWHAPGANVAEDDAEAAEKPRRSRTLRDKYKEDGDAATTRRLEQSRNRAEGSRRQRDLDNEQPKWQPFVPRTPRDRGYLGETVMRRLENGGTSVAKPKPIPIPELPNFTAEERTSKPSRNADADDARVDLLRNRFAKLGGPEPQLRGMSKTLRTNLPPERRAAALARVEKRMAEKKRARARNHADKENVRP